MTKSTVNQTITVLFFFGEVAKKSRFEQLKPAKSLTYSDGLKVLAIRFLFSDLQRFA